MENSKNTKETASEVIFEVLRYNPETDKKTRLEEYTVKVTKGMTVLDGLNWIKENLDNTLAWRSSCRMGVCGSCAMFINGRARLACNNQIMHINTKKLVIKPLPNFAIIKDLVPDLEDFFAKHRTIKPYLIREKAEELDNPRNEFFQSPEELANYIQFAYCIKCGICLAACPTCATDDRFTGPMALAQGWRYVSDSRDEGAEEREQELFSRHGVWRCHFAGACSDACPKGVDPAMAIQLLKRDMFFKQYEKRKISPARQETEEIKKWKPNPDIPKPPDPTV
jgi:succinate dehydrogenase / fumarate reductase, iron-sulfur subunit